MKAERQERQLPRLPRRLGPAPALLDRDEIWEEVEAGAGTVVPEHATDCEVRSSRLTGVRFTGAEMQMLRLLDVTLDDCEFSGAVLMDATFIRVEFTRCRMSGLVAPGLMARDVRWSECKLDGVNLRTAVFERCEWDGCIMRGADFSAAKLTHAAFSRCDLTEAEFFKAGCDQVRLHGSDLAGIKGAESLRGCAIGSDQVVPLALSVFATLGIVVDGEGE